MAILQRSSSQVNNAAKDSIVRITEHGAAAFAAVVAGAAAADSAGHALALGEPGNG